MKKFLVIAIVAVLIVGLIAAPVLAKGKSGQAGKSNIGHLYLYEKNPTDWSIVDGGAWGKMKYNLSGPTFDYVFNGHGLLAGTDYSLIYYADSWPGNNPGAWIASGTSNTQGDIHLMGNVELSIDLPDPGDDNYPGGAKIWLVLSSDYNSGATSTGPMTGWNPTEYLFEYDLITYDDTGV